MKHALLMLALCYLLVETCNAETKKTVDQSALDGTWAMNCDPSLLTGIRVNFKNGQYKSSVTKYRDSKCKVAQYKFLAKGTYKLTEQTAGAEHSFDYDVFPTEVKILPFTKEAAEAFRKQSFCGISDWEAKKLVDSRLCKKNDLSGKTCYGKAKIERGMLYTTMKSDANDCTSAAKRYVLFDADHPWYRTDEIMPADIFAN